MDIQSVKAQIDILYRSIPDQIRTLNKEIKELYLEVEEKERERIRLEKEGDRIINHLKFDIVHIEDGTQLHPDQIKGFCVSALYESFRDMLDNVGLREDVLSGLEKRLQANIGEYVLVDSSEKYFICGKIEEQPLLLNPKEKTLQIHTKEGRHVVGIYHDGKIGYNFEINKGDIILGKDEIIEICGMTVGIHIGNNEVREYLGDIDYGKLCETFPVIKKEQLALQLF